MGGRGPGRRDRPVGPSRVGVGGSRTATDDPKSAESERTLPVDDAWPGTATALRAAYLAARDKSPTGYVVTDVNGRPPHPDRLSAGFRRIAAEAGLPPIWLHRTRHTLALILPRAGMSPADAARWLGHSVETHIRLYLTTDD